MAAVTPRAGVWIEIGTGCPCAPPARRSLPVRECGLKYPGVHGGQAGESVTPRAGVWIEISSTRQGRRRRRSLPVRECGLKFYMAIKKDVFVIVTPRAGVWIEI